jgi:hypothetical protein
MCVCVCVGACVRVPVLCTYVRMYDFQCKDWSYFENAYLKRMFVINVRKICIETHTDEYALYFNIRNSLPNSNISMFPSMLHVLLIQMCDLFPTLILLLIHLRDLFTTLILLLIPLRNLFFSLLLLLIQFLIFSLPCYF